MGFLERAIMPQQRKDWTAWVAECWPEILAVVEAAEKARHLDSTLSWMKLDDALTALDKKADHS